MAKHIKSKLSSKSVLASKLSNHYLSIILISFALLVIGYPLGLALNPNGNDVLLGPIGGPFVVAALLKYYWPATLLVILLLAGVTSNRGVYVKLINSLIIFSACLALALVSFSIGLHEHPYVF